MSVATTCKRDGRVLDPREREVALQEGTEAARTHEVVAPPDEAQESAPQIGGKDVGAANRSPHVGQHRRAVRARVAGEPAGIDRAHRRPDEQVREDAALGERQHHAGLHGSEAAPSGQHECSGHRGTVERVTRTAGQNGRSPTTVTRSITRRAGRKSLLTMCWVARLSQNAMLPGAHRNRHCTSGTLAWRCSRSNIS